MSSEKTTRQHQGQYSYQKQRTQTNLYCRHNHDKQKWKILSSKHIRYAFFCHFSSSVEVRTPQDKAMIRASHWRKTLKRYKRKIRKNLINSTVSPCWKRYDAFHISDVHIIFTSLKSPHCNETNYICNTRKGLFMCDTLFQKG